MWLDLLEYALYGLLALVLAVSVKRGPHHDGATPYWKGYSGPRRGK